MEKIICFDLEGPLSSQDHAYEAMKIIPEGQKLFEIISRFDDILTLKGQKDYEPGNTLKLIAPFLILGGVTEAKLKEISQKAKLTPGAKELINKLKEAGWKIFIISTSYEQHAFQIAKRLAVSQNNVFCTKFPLDRFRKGRETWEIEVMGGVRKVKALRAIAKRMGISLKDLVVVGDSITDFKMLKKVKEAEGLAIVFNGNQYALPYGAVGCCSVSLKDLDKILWQWEKGGRPAVKEFILRNKNLFQYQWLVGKSPKELKPILKLHQKFRKMVRKEAAKLG